MAYLSLRMKWVNILILDHRNQQWKAIFVYINNSIFVALFVVFFFHLNSLLVYKVMANHYITVHLILKNFFVILWFFYIKSSQVLFLCTLPEKNNNILLEMKRRWSITFLWLIWENDWMTGYMHERMHIRLWIGTEWNCISHYCCKSHVTKNSRT